MPVSINEIRYLKRKNLKHEAFLQKNYFREIINHYGIDVNYFRLKMEWYASPSGVYSNYTYGENTTSVYEVSAPMVVFMKVDDDSPILRRFGIETTVNAEIYMMRQDFTEQFRDIVGIPTTGNFSTPISADISNFSGLISGEIIGNTLSGITSAWTTVPSGTISANYSAGFTRYPVAVNPDIARKIYFREREVNGTLDGTISGTVDLSGNGFISGTVSGLLNYFSPAYSLSGNSDWGIAPQVGDFFRLDEFDSDVSNYEEYEVTEVLDKQLTPIGLNPHLKRYIWRCTVVRRDPSNEIVEGSTQEEAFTPDYLEYNNWNQIVSDDIFNYDTEIIDPIDGTGSDSTYGGYGD